MIGIAQFMADLAAGLSPHHSSFSQSECDIIQKLYGR